MFVFVTVVTCVVTVVVIVVVWVVVVTFNGEGEECLLGSIEIRKGWADKGDEGDKDGDKASTEEEEETDLSSVLSKGDDSTIAGSTNTGSTITDFKLSWTSEYEGVDFCLEVEA